VFIVGGNQSAGGYEIANSIRYDQDASQYLRRTCGSSASSYTLSLWVKNCEPQGGSTTSIYWNGTGAKLNWEFNGSSQIYWYDPETRTTGSYRDVSAWYHLVWKVSSNVGTLYVNGSAAPGLTSVSGIDSLNSGNFIYLGSDNGGSPQNGYFAEVCFIDGTALDPTSFGEYDEDSGIWKPIDVSGLSFGSNGFYLDFEDSSALGNDVSGNNNDLTSAGFTSLNQTTDTPTNNFATYNPLINKSSGVPTMSNGNLTLTTNACEFGSVSSIGVSQGKWYCEIKWDSGLYAMVGITGDPIILSTNSTAYAGITADSWGYHYSGNVYNNNSTLATYSTFATSDILGIALDLDNNKLYFSKNGTWQNSADPSAGTNGISITSASSVAEGNYFMWVGNSSSAGNATLSANFGNPPFTISSGNSDGNGYGNFEYTVPSGYYALNTTNLAEYG